MSVASVIPPTAANPAKRHPLSAFYRSSIGKKWIVALTGLALLGFVLGHLLGNLQFFLPDKEQINDYAVHLRNLGPLLWVIRISLLVIFSLHIFTTIQLVLQNRAASPSKYAVKKPQRSTLASRTMIYSGLLVLCFVVYHILHFTLMALHPEYQHLEDPHGRHDVYSMMVLGFQNPGISIFYIVSVTLLALHLNHGIASTLQTLGLSSHRLAPFFNTVGRTVSVVIGLGFASMPLAVLTGLVKLPVWFHLPS